MKLYLSCIIVTIFCSLVLTVNGQTESHISVMQRVHIVPDAEMTIKNDGAGDLAPVHNVEYVAVVDLVYGRELLTDIANDQWGFKIKFEVLDEADNVVGEDSLTIQCFVSKTVYIDQARFEVPEGFAKLKITNIYTSDNEWFSETQNLLDVIINVPEDVRLELRMEGSRYDFIENSSSPSIQITELGDNAMVEWTHVTGAETYQVEFGFVSSSLFTGYTEAEPFRNPVRIEVKENYYNLPLTYPKGNLYVRVRPVGRHLSGIDPQENYRQRVGNWSESQSIEIEFQTDQHWQATTTFAEEGKIKKVIEYYDDGLKLRQTATNQNTDTIAIRSTVHYDFEGRPVINVLPAPDLTNNSLGYYPNYNFLDPVLFENNAPATLSSFSGAGKYYSSMNPATIGVHTQYVPDAFGYPYSRMKYLNDNTGRLLSQSGIGHEYKIGSGRETQYFFDDPSDTQLRRLFGHNVGAAKYYKRNIIMDPDSQLSVTYVDISGKTIATALAGKSPPTVIPLESEEEGTYTIIEDLIANNVIDTASSVSRLTTTLFNEQPGTLYTFDYSLTGLIVDHEAEICVSCEYLLYFEILNPCGDSVYKDTISFTQESLCTDTIYESTLASFSYTFDSIGLYTVSKTLISVPPSMEQWLEILSDILPDSAYFAELYLSQIDTTECVQSCDQMCRDSLRIAMPELTDEELELEVLRCVYETCLDPLYSEAGSYLCEAIHTQMVFQMQEGGCYYENWAEEPGALMGLTFINDGQEVPGVDMYPILIGNSIWEDSWGDTLALIHPDTCCYRFCLEMAPSRSFDLKLNFLYTWEDVIADFDFVVDVDSFFMSGHPGHSFASEMRDSLATFGTSGSNHNLDGCDWPELIPISIFQFIECVMPDSLPQTKWSTYVSLYQGLKDKFIRMANTCSEPTGMCTACIDIPESFQSVEDVDGAIEFANVSLDSLCGDVCHGQATMIANMLIDSCSNATWQELYDTLYNHCQLVCGWQNPLGMFLEEDLETPSMDAIIEWLDAHDCDTQTFDTLIVVPFDSVYMPLGYPQNAGTTVSDTVCIGDSLNLFVLHDSLYKLTIHPDDLDSLLGDQLFLMDTGLYYFVGYDPLCGQFAEPPSYQYDTASFAWFEESSTWTPGTLMGAWPQLAFDSAGCYTFGFYAPSMPGACSDYSEITVYVPSCDEVQLVVDSIDNCVVAAHLEFGPWAAPIDTIIWTVQIDDNPLIPYIEGDTLTGGNSYEFEVIIYYSMCCDTLQLRGALNCECLICEEQSVELCEERLLGFVTMDGDTIVLSFDPHCDSPLNDLLMQNIEDILNQYDQCGEIEVYWEDIGDECPCIRIVVEGSSIIFDFAHTSGPDYPFDTDGCLIGRSQPIIAGLVSTRPKEDNSYINIYPNPAKNSFYIAFNHPYVSDHQFSVIMSDYSGSIVYNELFSGSGTFDEVLVDATGLLPGVYKVMVRDTISVYASSIIIMRQ